MSVLSQKDWNYSNKMGRAKWSLIYGFSFALVFSMLSEVFHFFNNEFVLLEFLKTFGLGVLVATSFNYFLFWHYNKWRYKKAKNQP